MIRLSEQMRGEICGITVETLVDNEIFFGHGIETATLQKMSFTLRSHSQAVKTSCESE